MMLKRIAAMTVSLALLPAGASAQGFGTTSQSGAARVAPWAPPSHGVGELGLATRSTEAPAWPEPAWTLPEDVLSPAEKLDLAEGRLARVDYAAIEDALNANEAVEAIRGQVSAARTEAAALLEKQALAGELPNDWRMSPAGVVVAQKTEELDGLWAPIETALMAGDIDTVTESEIYDALRARHYGAQPGAWEAHWAAATVSVPAPAGDEWLSTWGLAWSGTDIRALLTAQWRQSAGHPVGAALGHSALQAQSNQPLTPAAWHQVVSEHLGDRGRGLVAVWRDAYSTTSRPLLAFDASVAPAYPADDQASPLSVRIDLSQTDYALSGVPQTEVIPGKSVYPVAVSCRVWWLAARPSEASAWTSSAPPALELATPSADGGVALADDLQPLVRSTTWTYTLWLTHPLGSPQAAVVGDGEWTTATESLNSEPVALGTGATPPSFVWAPAAWVQPAVSSGGERFEPTTVDALWGVVP